MLLNLFPPHGRLQQSQLCELCFPGLQSGDLYLLLILLLQNLVQRFLGREWVVLAPLLQIVHSLDFLLFSQSHGLELHVILYFELLLRLGFLLFREFLVLQLSSNFGILHLSELLLAALLFSLPLLSPLLTQLGLSLLFLKVFLSVLAVLEL